MASERVTLEAAGGLNPVDQRRLDELRAANAQGHPQGIRQDPGAPTHWTVTTDIYGNEYITAGGSGGVGGTGADGAFKFDWNKARNDAFNELKPYYDEKLKQANGDIARAKMLIDEDYNKGLRVAREDFEIGEKARTEDLASERIRLTGEEAQETKNLRGELNQKGLLLGEIDRGAEGASRAPESVYAKTAHMDPLVDKQKLRREAIERALTRQSEVARVDRNRQEADLGTERKRGIEEQDIAAPRVEKDLLEEQRKRAFLEVAPAKYQMESTRKAGTELPIYNK